MKKLSDFKDGAGIVVASKVLSVIMDILSDQRNMKQQGETNTIKMFTAFMGNSPEKMREIFAVLSEKEVEEYHCDGAEAMANMLILANDPIVISLFASQSQTRGATSSGSVSETTEVQQM